jgi:hypothetical protein
VSQVTPPTSHRNTENSEDAEEKQKLLDVDAESVKKI